MLSKVSKTFYQSFYERGINFHNTEIDTLLRLLYY